MADPRLSGVLRDARYGVDRDTGFCTAIPLANRIFYELKHFFGANDLDRKFVELVSLDAKQRSSASLWIADASGLLLDVGENILVHGVKYSSIEFLPDPVRADPAAVELERNVDDRARSYLRRPPCFVGSTSLYF